MTLQLRNDYTVAEDLVALQLRNDRLAVKNLDTLQPNNDRTAAKDLSCKGFDDHTDLQTDKTDLSD